MEKDPVVSRGHPVIKGITSPLHEKYGCIDSTIDKAGEYYEEISAKLVDWNEEHVWFYLHFQNGEAIRQIEITPASKLKLTSSNPLNGDSMLYDQSLDNLDLKEADFITEEAFDKIWNEK